LQVVRLGRGYYIVFSGDLVDVDDFWYPR